MSRRQRSALPEPTPARVARVVDVTVAGREFHRATGASRSTMWWFNARDRDPEEAGRFDLASPHGTCYLADDPVAALLERLWDPGDQDPLIPHRQLETTMVWQGRLTRTRRAADTTDRSSRLPKELGASTDYRHTWAWADALHDDGREGLIYWLRRDPAATRGLAVFGPASAPDRLPGPAEWPTLPQRVLATVYRDELAVLADILEDAPALDELEIAAEPED